MLQHIENPTYGMDGFSCVSIASSVKVKEEEEEEEEEEAPKLVDWSRSSGSSGENSSKVSILQEHNGDFSWEAASSGSKEQTYQSE